MILKSGEMSVCSRRIRTDDAVYEWGKEEEEDSSSSYSRRGGCPMVFNGAGLTLPRRNKNRLCSMTYGIDKIFKMDRLDAKSSFVEEAEGQGSKRSFKLKEEIPPRREIGSRSDRS